MADQLIPQLTPGGAISDSTLLVAYDDPGPMTRRTGKQLLNYLLASGSVAATVNATNYPAMSAQAVALSSVANNSGIFVYNPIQFGASGTGTADDTAAITQMIGGTSNVATIDGLGLSYGLSSTIAIGGRTIKNFNFIALAGFSGARILAPTSGFWAEDCTFDGTGMANPSGSYATGIPQGCAWAYFGNTEGDRIDWTGHRNCTYKNFPSGPVLTARVNYPYSDGNKFINNQTYTGGETNLIENPYFSKMVLSIGAYASGFNWKAFGGQANDVVKLVSPTTYGGNSSNAALYTRQNGKVTVTGWTHDGITDGFGHKSFLDTEVSNIGFVASHCASAFQGYGSGMIKIQGIVRDATDAAIELDTLGAGTDTAFFTGSITGTVMTVTGTPTGGPIAVGMGIRSAGVAVADATFILSLGTGTGGAGTYNVTVSQTLASEALIGVVPSPINEAHVEVESYRTSVTPTQTTESALVIRADSLNQIGKISGKITSRGGYSAVFCVNANCLIEHMTLDIDVSNIGTAGYPFFLHARNIDLACTIGAGVAQGGLIYTQALQPDGRLMITKLTGPSTMGSSTEALLQLGLGSTLVPRFAHATIANMEGDGAGSSTNQFATLDFSSATNLKTLVLSNIRAYGYNKVINAGPPITGPFMVTFNAATATPTLDMSDVSIRTSTGIAGPIVITNGNKVLAGSLSNVSGIINVRPAAVTPYKVTDSYTPSAIATQAYGAARTLTVTGAAIGDLVSGQVLGGSSALPIVGSVTAANTVTYCPFNPTAGTVTLGASVATIIVTPTPQI